MEDKILSVAEKELNFFFIKNLHLDRHTQTIFQHALTSGNIRKPSTTSA